MNSSFVFSRSAHSLTSIIILGTGVLLVSCSTERNISVDEQKVSVNSKDCCQWLFECYTNIKTIKVNSSRADLLRKFSPAGGFSTGQVKRYVYNECPYIYVDVEFQVREDYRSESTNDRIIQISEPNIGLAPSD